jgi:hypothetical protein
VYRLAPIRVSYLGYTGTMGAEFIDHIIVDRFAVPQATTVFCRAAGMNKLFLVWRHCRSSPALQV